jgi:hypothetical protein
MKNHFIFLLLGALLLSSFFLLSFRPGPQEQELIYDDHIYDPNIRTVLFYRGTFTNSYPVIFLENQMPLTLEFDEILPIEEAQSDFQVDFISCDHNWQPTYSIPIEFYEGFTQEPIYDYRFSENTKTNYVHYTYSFPGEEGRFKMSGNYLLKVSRSYGDQEVVLTRRFVVVERKAHIQPSRILNARLERQRLDEMAFTVTPSGQLRIYNPASELIVKVMQNWRWDNALEGITPRFLGNGQYEYIIDDLNYVFPGGNEFRFHDCRSTQFYGETVKDISETDEMYYYTLFKDETRLKNTYGPRADLNGNYIIDVQEYNFPDYEADYVSNTFRLHAPNPIPNHKVYVYGAFSMWKPQPWCQLVYDEVAHRYEADILLKQGYYDYKYVAVDNATGIINESMFEGNASDTENYYTVLIYHRMPTDRYHKLIGYQTINYYDE